jgi:hypothetical protein
MELLQSDDGGEKSSVKVIVIGHSLVMARPEPAQCNDQKSRNFLEYACRWHRRSAKTGLRHALPAALKLD